jgi:hypothetical protein
MVLTLVAAAAAGCGRTGLDPPVPLPTGNAIAMDPVFDQTVNSDLDIVFMIDNSGSMREEQANLIRNFPVFINALESLPEGLPSLHIGVVSSDLGAGRSLDVAGCQGPDGDGGIFQAAPRGDGGACTSAPKGQSYIVADGASNNFEGSVTDALSCIADLGTNGCGFEHQLASVRKALGGDTGGVPRQNAGFLRDGALLAIVFITDEDDCSAPDDSDLFDPSQTLISDPLGPLDSYRCNEFGHLCDGVPPPRFTPATELADCHSNEKNGKLIKIGDFVKFFQSLKDDPNGVIVAAITGPATPYSVELTAVDKGSGVSEEEPRIVASCQSSNGLAAPAVRIKDFIDAFGVNGTQESICDADFSPAMTRIGNLIAGRVRHQCVEGRLADHDPDQPGVQPSCEVFEETSAGDAVIRTALPACDGATPPCWRLEADQSCATLQEVVVDRGDLPAAPHTRITVLCETCTDPLDPRCAGLD